MREKPNNDCNEPVTIRSINTLLVANRGEIAARIMRTAASMGIRTVAVYSDVDANALHVKSADMAVAIGSAPPAMSYLNIAAIIDAAKTSGADAIHPGYGFLSENPDFVEACTAADILFVGPDAESMRAMGLKDSAKALMEDAGVPVVPGYHGETQDTTFLLEQAKHIGYPVLIKARAGGGGKGMRKVEQPEQFVAALEAAQREAAASFGDSAVLIEKYIEHPRHIEVQVFGDQYGQCVHLFERDCSLQRRHQKVIEEAPAPNMTDELREAMTAAAIRTAQSINYVGAGTVEFIVDASGPLRADGFWFMEMNTRLQVEHPVTEAVTGVDLVQWQLLIASGHRLPLAQHDIQLSGHAVEARLYAEDVKAGFLPATGTLHRFALAEHGGRVDTGVSEGDGVQPYYDPMLAKLVAHGPDRTSAFRQIHNRLEKSIVMGVTTNRAFLSSLCMHDEVLAGRVHTHFIEQCSPFKSNSGSAEATQIRLNANTALAAVVSTSLSTSARSQGDNNRPVFSELGIWQLWGQANRAVTLLDKQQPEKQPLVLRVTRLATTQWQVSFDSTFPVRQRSGNTVSTDSIGFDDTPILLTILNLQALVSGTRIKVNGCDVFAMAVTHADSVFCQIGPDEAHYILPVTEHAENVMEGGLHLIAPMPGRILQVSCQPGDRVSKGDVLMTLEAMKMEHNLVAVADTRIDTVLVNVNDQVEQGMPVVVFKNCSN